MSGRRSSARLARSCITPSAAATCQPSDLPAKRARQSPAADTGDQSASSKRAHSVCVDSAPEQRDVPASVCVDSTPEKKAVPASPSKGMSPGSPAALRSELLKLCIPLKVLHPSIGLSWYKAMQPEFEKPYFKKLSDFVTAQRQQHTVFPRAQDVFSWATGDVSDVKVVILGQDPYHGPGQAHGLCFSVQRGVRPPPSLVNMYKELEADVPGFRHPGHGCLTGWARQGVLLLNACLTVRSGQPNSHKDQGWEQFADAVIKHISNHQKHVVFMLWGSYAQKKGSVVDKSRHHVLASTHPSPLSAHRGFLGCRHFSKCNELLTQHKRTPIDWNDLPPE